MVKVRTFHGGTDSFEQAVRFLVDMDTKNLKVIDRISNTIAEYADGHWASVVVEPKKD